MTQNTSYVAHVEVCLHPRSCAHRSNVKDAVLQFLQARPEAHYKDGRVIFSSDTFLRENVYSMECALGGIIPPDVRLKVGDLKWRVYPYRLNDVGMAEEDLDDEDNESLPACNNWILPAQELHGLWESLIYDTEIKNRLLEYVNTAMLFSDRRINPHLINWNRVILLHGPPGTGKTSLCKAFAQKIAIRLSQRYTEGQLVEINAHSLFSKWFSESGKLVMKLFKRIQEMAEDSNTFVCIMIDEVESLTAARKSSMAGSEPSDAIRVVNALLTQIDLLKSLPNVLILTTSNVTGAIDLAFVDRADVKQYIGPPSLAARYSIFKGCLEELMNVGIIRSSCNLLDHRSLGVLAHAGQSESTRSSAALLDIAQKAEGLSGRALRKLPFIAHASFVQVPECSMEEFLKALLSAVDMEQSSRQELDKD